MLPTGKPEVRERHSAIVGDLTAVPSLSFSLKYSGMCFEIGSSKESFFSSTRTATKVAVIGLVMEAIETGVLFFQGLSEPT